MVYIQKTIYVKDQVEWDEVKRRAEESGQTVSRYLLGGVSQLDRIEQKLDLLIPKGMPKGLEEFALEKIKAMAPAETPTEILDRVAAEKEILEKAQKELEKKKADVPQKPVADRIMEKAKAQAKSQGQLDKERSGRDIKKEKIAKAKRDADNKVIKEKMARVENLMGFSGPITKTSQLGKKK